MNNEREDFYRKLVGIFVIIIVLMSISGILTSIFHYTY